MKYSKHKRAITPSRWSDQTGIMVWESAYINKKFMHTKF